MDLTPTLVVTPADLQSGAVLECMVDTGIITTSSPTVGTPSASPPYTQLELDIKTLQALIDAHKTGCCLKSNTMAQYSRDKVSLSANWYYPTVDLTASAQRLFGVIVAIADIVPNVINPPPPLTSPSQSIQQLPFGKTSADTEFFPADSTVLSYRNVYVRVRGVVRLFYNSSGYTPAIGDSVCVNGGLAVVGATGTPPNSHMTGQIVAVDQANTTVDVWLG